ncbi:MAG: hypothetical protein KDG52_12765 [Rhodocyclaceae bacterium]|nr:hypothetical protein [Rhodocyclaceae bacterium]
MLAIDGEAAFEAVIDPTEAPDVRCLLLPLVAGAALLTAPVQAAEPQSAGSRHAADVAPRPQPTEPSAFDGYRRFDPYPEPIGWRDANDEVGRLGGFGGHMQPRGNAAKRGRGGQ